MFEPNVQKTKGYINVTFAQNFCIDMHTHTHTHVCSYKNSARTKHLYISSKCLNTTTYKAYNGDFLVDENEESTTVRLKKATVERVGKFGKYGDSFDEIVNKVCEIAEARAKR